MASNSRAKLSIKRQSIFCLSLLSLFFTTFQCQISRADEPVSRAELKVVELDKWWRAPRWSPDGRYVVVQGPANEKITSPVPRRDSTVGFTFKGGPPGTSVLLRTRDNFVIGKIPDVVTALWSPNSKYFAVWRNDHSKNESDVRIYTPYNGACVCTISSDCLQKFDENIAWANDGHRLLVTNERSVTVFDMDSRNTRRLNIDSKISKLYSVHWSFDGTKILGMSIDTEKKDELGNQENKADKSDKSETHKLRLYIWNAHTGALVAHQETNSQPTMLCWFPDSSRILTLEAELFRIYDSTLHKISTVKTPCVPYFLPALQWSPDGKKLACRDYTDIHILDAYSLAEICKIPAARNGRFSLSWYSDSKMLLVFGGRTLALCDTEEGKYLTHIIWPEPIVDALFSPGNKTVAISPFNDTVHLLGVRPPEKYNQKVRTSYFIEGGKFGSPGWELHAAPATLEECYAAFDKELTPANRERFKNTDEKKLSDYGGCGIVVDELIYDVYNEWDNRALLKSFADKHVTDDREIIWQVIKGYWDYLHKT